MRLPFVAPAYIAENGDYLVLPFFVTASVAEIGDYFASTLIAENGNSVLWLTMMPEIMVELLKAKCRSIYRWRHMYRMPRTYTRCIHIYRQLTIAFVAKK